MAHFHDPVDRDDDEFLPVIIVSDDARWLEAEKERAKERA
jgi:hypothetical protein